MEEVSRAGHEKTAVDDLLARIEQIQKALPADEDEPPAEEYEEIQEPAADIIYEESYDKELFSIFREQLETALVKIEKQTLEWVSGSLSETILADCKADLLRLCSSANYMEYDELKALYLGWIKAINAFLKRSNEGAAPDMADFAAGVMQANVARVRRFFLPSDAPTMPTLVEAEISEAPAGASIGEAPAEAFDSAEATAPADVIEDADAITEPVYSQEETLEEYLIRPESGEEDANEESLLARLENAFDAKINLDLPFDGAVESPLDAMGLLSDDEATEIIPEPMVSELSAKLFTADKDADSGRDVEAFLFSDAVEPQTIQVAPAPKPVPKPTQAVEQKQPLQPESDDVRDQSAPSRRQSDKFRDRLLKQSIRVDASKIDILMNQVGELVVTRAGFNQLFSEMRELQLMLKQSQKLDPKEMQWVKELTGRINAATVSLGRITSELQENVMKVRMLPIAQLFSRYPRVVHDLVRNSDKKVDLEIRGEETELDRMVIEQISDPLVHIIRNAVDHGIEAVGERQRKGKPETGTLRLEAYHEGNYVVIEVSDDGNGIDPETIKAVALAKDFLTAEEAAHMDKDEILALIMRPGFSTRDEVTHTSGRGVGMDVVKDHIEKLNGTIDIESTPGRGTLFKIKIPLTLAIIPALMVRVAGEIFTIPLSTVDETIRVHQNEISTIEGMEIYYLRESTLPLIRIAEVFKMQAASVRTKELFVVVVNSGSRQVGLVVDQLRGREEVVIKPLEDYLQEKSGFSGATILGDGSISLILDVSDVVHLAIDQHAKKMKVSAA